MHSASASEHLLPAKRRRSPHRRNQTGCKRRGRALEGQHKDFGCARVDVAERDAALLPARQVGAARIERRQLERLRREFELALIDDDRRRRVIRCRLRPRVGVFAVLELHRADAAFFQVTDELPGLAESDVEVSLNQNILTIKGEKKFRGKLVEVNADNFVIVVNNFNLKLTYTQVKKINLDPDLKSAADKGE